MRTSDLRELIPEDRSLSEQQQRNISSLLDLSGSFANDAGFESGNTPTVQEDTVILESGHQPNFLPYSGVWKKAFLLHRFGEMLNEVEVQGMGFFGFLDQNTTTASYLYKNQVPALNKNGTQKIGFNVNRSEKWQRFNRIEKPPLEIWEDEMAQLENLYSDCLPENTKISEILWSSYERAKSFSDLNAFIFSNISREMLGCDVFFFKYSDLMQKKIFPEECKHILENLDIYNSLYNEVIRKEHLKFRPMVTGEIPFWYHCSCGGKIALVMDSSGVCKGTCPLCNESYELDFDSDFRQLEAFLDNMSFSAVSRNLIFSEGLGTHVFISGPGGGLRYGKISDAISSAVDFNRPVTISWSSADYYLGEIHTKAIEELRTTFSLSKEDLLKSTLNERISECQRILEAKVREMKAETAGKKGLRLNTGRLTGKTQADMVSRIFSTVPSLLDLCMNFSCEYIAESWREALNCSVPEMYDTACIMAQDVVYEDRENASEYSPDEIPVLYRNLSAIGGEEK